MRDDIKGHTSQLNDIQNATSSTSADVLAMRQLLEGSLGLGGGGGQASWDWNSGKAQGKGHQTAGGGVIPAATNVPVCKAMMTNAQHELALSYIGISKAREDVATWAKQIPNEGLAFVAWWTEISKKKSLSQWQRKLENLGATPEQRQGLDLPGVGSLLYRFLDSEGEWTDTPMQDAPVAA